MPAHWSLLASNATEAPSVAESNCRAVIKMRHRPSPEDRTQRGQFLDAGVRPQIVVSVQP